MIGEIKKLFAKLVCVSMIFSSAPVSTYASSSKNTTNVAVKNETHKRALSKVSTSFHITNLPAKTLTLKKGKSKTITVKINGKKKLSKSATLKKLTWKSSNKKVVSVNTKGKLKALKKGKAKVTVALKSNKKKRIVIAVIVGTPVSKIRLNAKNLVVKLGTSQTLTASVLPGNASNKKIIWKSSNNGIATVNHGVVNGLSKGSVSIEAIAADGSSKKAVANVTVADDQYSYKPANTTAPSSNPASSTINPTSISMTDESDASLAIGESMTLYASVSPSNATNKNIKWSTSDASIVSIDDHNSYTSISAKKSGTVTITAIAEASPNISTSKTITVYDSSDNSKGNTTDGSGANTSDSSGTDTSDTTTDDTSTNPTTITLSNSDIIAGSQTLSMKKRDYEYIYASIDTTDVNKRGIEWSSDNTSIVNVGNSGMYSGTGTYASYACLVGNSTGTATITARSTYDSSIYATLKVIVKDSIVYATSMTVKDDSQSYSNGESISMPKNGTKTMTVSLSPDNVTENVNWSSSDSSIVSVIPDSSDPTKYTWKANGVGTATVSMTVKSGEYSTINISITVNVTSRGSTTVYSQSGLEEILNDGYDTIELAGGSSYEIPEGDYSQTNLKVSSASTVKNKGLFKNITLESCDTFTENTSSSLGKNNFSLENSEFKNLIISSDAHAGAITAEDLATSFKVIDHGSIDEINVTDANTDMTLEGTSENTPVNVNLTGSNITLRSYLPVNVSCESTSMLYLCDRADTSATDITASNSHCIPTIYGTGSYGVYVTSTGATQIVSTNTINSTISGTVKDAGTEAEGSISGITVKLYNGSNQSLDENYIATSSTDSSGAFSFGSLPAGDYTVWFEDERSGVSSDDQYISKSENITVDNNATTTKYVFMSQKLSSNQLRYVVSWDTTNDFDTHLYVADGDNDAVQRVYYGSRTYTGNETTVARLNMDSHSNAQCETMTIEHPIANQTYTLYVGNNSALPSSGAKVEIYMGGGLEKTVHIPSTGNGSVWKASIYYYYSSGNSRLVTPNTLSNSYS